MKLGGFELGEAFGVSVAEGCEFTVVGTGDTANVGAGEGDEVTLAVGCSEGLGLGLGLELVLVPP
ncbi:hypothetical protein D3C85_1876080 [compost metagenome]